MVGLGRISRINLTDNTVYAEDLDPEMANNYSKGRALSRETEVLGACAPRFKYDDFPLPCG